MKIKKEFKNLIFIALFSSFLTAIFFSALFSFLFYKKLSLIPPQKIIERQILEKPKEIEKKPTYLPQTTQEEKVMKIYQKVSPSVFSIVVKKKVATFEEFFQEFFGFKVPSFKEKIEEKEIGWGTGFIVREDGIALTNKHVVADENAKYIAVLEKNRKYPIKVLAKDPFQDLAIIKLEGDHFKPLPLGNSDKVQIGQTVIAIGNALGEFQNTVSVGVVSGLGRRIVASGGGKVEVLEDVIQTDAAINPGNSGGPLLNLEGEVIGINTAVAYTAENIGFAIPINRAKKDLEKFEKRGKITYAFLGIWYWTITEELAKEMNLPVKEGAWITSWRKDKFGRWYRSSKPAVIRKSPAEKAGLKEGDIILKFGNEKITPSNPLAKIIQKYEPEDEVILKVLRGRKEIKIKVKLGERPTNL